MATIAPQRPRTAAATMGAAATAHPLATRASLEILAAGGNAIDAAAAGAWALCVCEPSGSGLGGQTTLLVHPSTGGTFILDGHSRAPAAVSRRTVNRLEQHAGHKATTIPSTPITLGEAQRRFGRLMFSKILEPAIRLAEDGFAISRLQHRQTSWVAAALSAHEPTARCFLPGGAVPKIGQILRQPLLAKTLRRLASAEIEDFYVGDMSRSIDRDMKTYGGLLSAGDLAASNSPVYRAPAVIEHGNYTFITNPAPGGGPQLLASLEQYFALADSGIDSWEERIVQSVLHAFREREYRATAEEPGETTHLCVADAEGNIVSLTQSIQSLFGAKVAHAGLGFLYNNYLTTCPRRNHANALRGGCRPRSNVSPTLVLLKGRPFLVLGAAGSRRIVSSVLQVITRVIDQHLPLHRAIDAPRLHPLLNGKLWAESPFTVDTMPQAIREGFPTIVAKRRHDYDMACVQALAIGPDGEVEGAADPRRDGAAAVLR